MKPKISVLLSTNKINTKCFKHIKKVINGLDNLQENTFTEEFKGLVSSYLPGVRHFLEPTLRSLESQLFKDFEFVLCHRYPEDAKEVIKGWSFPIKLVKEKPSIWHELGDRYHTVANAKNTSFINSSGELIYHIDDLSFFNAYLLKEAWKLYKKGKYVTGRTVRCITYNKQLYPKYNVTIVGPNKTNITKNGWYGQLKPLTNDYNMNPEIHMNRFWTCSASVSAKELLDINGYDELYDGSLAGIDMDAGTRLSNISKYKRVASYNYLYEINDPTDKNMVRDDVMMRQIFRVNHIKANSWKPNKIQVNRYKRWHEHTLGELDDNWNKFMDVPLYNVERHDTENDRENYY